MAQPFTGQIETFGFSFAPKNWAFCAGQVLAIAQNQALFSLLGVTFGGDGIRTFALPDLRGRVANGWGQGPGQSPYDLGQQGGEEVHTISRQEMPSAPPHQHQINAVANDTSSGQPTPGPAVMLGRGYVPSSGFPAVTFYSTSTATVTLTSTTAVGGASHENRVPFNVLNYCICLQGLFPSRD